MRERHHLLGRCSLRGDVFIRVRCLATGTTRRIALCNKIVHGGFSALVALLDTGDAQSIIARLRVGTGVTPPATSDTDLSAPIATSDPVNFPWGKVDFSAQKQESSATVGGPYELIVQATVPGGSSSDPYNGQTLTEAGLITAGGNLFSRQVHPAIQKTTSIAIDYEWRIRLIPA